MGKAKKIVLVVVVVVIAGGLWARYDMRTKPANEKIRAGVAKILAMYPGVQPMYDGAMEDGVLTTLEAKAIVDRANELKEQ